VTDARLFPCADVGVRGTMLLKDSFVAAVLKRGEPSPPTEEEDALLAVDDRDTFPPPPTMLMRAVCRGVMLPRMAAVVRRAAAEDGQSATDRAGQQQTMSTVGTHASSTPRKSAYPTCMLHPLYPPRSCLLRLHPPRCLLRCPSGQKSRCVSEARLPRDRRGHARLGGPVLLSRLFESFQII
jgi:hypothetical protein